MARLKWDQTGERLFETGTDRGVYYGTDAQGNYVTGVAWNGLTGVTESPDGAEETPLYADNIKYLSLFSQENFKGTITAYTYPDEFEDADGSKEIAVGVRAGQQRRRPFGLSYRTLIGNDVDETGHGYKLHLVYGAKVSPSERAYETVNDTPAAITFSWAFVTTPTVPTNFDMEPTAHVIIDSTKVDAAKLKALEDMLYGGGTGSADPKLPTLDEVIAMFPTSGTVAVTGVTVDKPTASVAVGANTTIVATVAPANATNKTVTWASDATAKATVDQSGKVTGVAAGTANITATAGGKTATSVVTVTAP